ncbi:MAG: BMP family ABC transporter substrate-binding protein [Lachnospiraceae bacterium]|nr:BMP family ABC transporter substrate-binding protein [Lachnospiraceae bacterium]
MRKKLTRLMLALFLFLMLIGCGKKDDAKEAADNNEGADSGMSSEEGGAGAEEPSISVSSAVVTLGDEDAKMSFAMVSDVGGINDHSFNQGAWEGLKFLNENMDARVSYIASKSVEDFEPSLMRLADQGNEVVWGVGYHFEDAIMKAAAARPDIHFGIVDFAYEKMPPNVTCATFRAEEPAFLVGYIAAAVSETGKVGYIGGMDVEPLEPFYYGYLSGVKQADKDLGRETEVLTEYINSFEDASLARNVAEKMYDGGADVVFHVAGGAGIGVIVAAGFKDKYVIGVDCDQSYLDPAHVLTSAVKKVDVAISNISVQYAMGDNIDGRIMEYGLAEHAVGIPESNPNVPEDVMEAVRELEKNIIYNNIDVPMDEVEYKEFCEAVSE